jgi:hypothetical protein
MSLPVVVKTKKTKLKDLWLEDEDDALGLYNSDFGVSARGKRNGWIRLAR